MPKPTIQTATPEEIKAAFRRLQSRQGKGICELCDNVFNKRQRNQRFCSTSCRSIWWRLKAEVEATRAAESEREWAGANVGKSLDSLDDL